jgi:hypothetical protein
MDSIQGRNEQASEYLGTQNPGIASWRVIILRRIAVRPRALPQI